MDKEIKGSQRLSLAKLQAWEKLEYGMFIHFGMSTFEGKELPDGKASSKTYAPDQLDVEQWVSVARDAGMKYAVLTAKHVAGHALWPTKLNDYHVGTSGNTTDVVEVFVETCRKKGVMPGLYYCSWDNHSRFGSLTPDASAPFELPFKTSNPMLSGGVQYSFVTRTYMDFQSAQIEELLTQYGPIGEVWIDIPSVLPRFYRQELYDQIAGLQPEAVVMMNNGTSDGSQYPVEKAWPADLIAIERFLPNSHTGHVKWRDIEGKKYYMPGEVCEPIGKEWFFTENDVPRSDKELLGMYLASVSRGANLLLDVGPDKRGIIPNKYVDALMRLRKNLDVLGF